MNKRRRREIVPLAHDSIVQELSAGVMILDPEVNVLNLNPAAVEILGVGSQAYQGRPLADMVVGNSGITETLGVALDGANGEQQNLQITTPESGRSYQVQISPVGGNPGVIIGWLIHINDISQLLEAEASLATTQQTFESVLDTLQDPYFEADPTGKISYVNQAFVNVTRHSSKDELIGKHFRHVVSRKSVRRFYDNFKKLYTTNGSILPFELIYRTKDGTEFTSEIVVSPIMDKGMAVGSRGIVRDISVRVEAEKIVTKAKEAAELRASELAAINRVATIVNRSLDLDEILQSACVEFTRIFPVRNTGIALLDDDRNTLTVAAFHAIDPIEESALGLVLELDGNTASQKVIMNRKTVLVHDAQTDPRTKLIHELSRARGSGSFMIVPLVARGEAIGTIGMPAKDPQHDFTQSEIELAETIASQIATAVDNARLYSQTEMALGLVERDLEIGREIQAGFFPGTLPDLPGWEIAVHFQAARQVAGDFYDSFQFRNSNFTAIIIADVCDKGVGAALFMVLFRSLLRAFSEAEITQENAQERLREIVLNTNNFIAEYHGQSNMFATMFFGILDPDRGSLYYINGGHEPPILMDKDAQVSQRLMPTGPAVGMFVDMEYQVKEIHIDKGDILVGFTDGATDAKNSAGELFTEERLLKSIHAPWTSIFSMVYELYTGLRNHIGGQGQYDDITLISFRRKLIEDTDYHAICRPAEMDILTELRDFVEAAAVNTGLAPEEVFAFKLATEEVCNNIIQFGYEGEEPGYIAMAFEKNKDKARLKVWDDGRYYPPDQAESPDIEADWHERQIGAMGIYLYKEFMDRVTYKKEENKTNLLVLEKKLHKM